MRWLSLIPWFHLAYSSYTCLRIEFGTGIHLFELQKPSLLYISCLTFFWWLYHSFQRLQGLMRNFLTGYVILYSFSFLGGWLCSYWFISPYYFSRIQSAASSLHSLASHIGIYGVPGFQKGKNIDFSESGLMTKMVFLDTYSAEYLVDLWYHTLPLLEHTPLTGYY